MTGAGEETLIMPTSQETTRHPARADSARRTRARHNPAIGMMPKRVTARPRRDPAPRTAAATVR